MLMQENGFSCEMKLELFIMGRNSLLMRIENIGDIFNSNGVVIPAAVDLKGLANGLFAHVNGDDISATVEITELTISGNMPIDYMTETKIQWATEDDAFVTRAAPSMNDTTDVIVLQQQRIRVFEVNYTPTTEGVKFLQ